VLPEWKFFTKPRVPGRQLSARSYGRCQ